MKDITLLSLLLTSFFVSSNESNFNHLTNLTNTTVQVLNNNDVINKPYCEIGSATVSVFVKSLHSEYVLYEYDNSGNNIAYIKNEDDKTWQVGISFDVIKNNEVVKSNSGSILAISGCEVYDE